MSDLGDQAPHQDAPVGGSDPNVSMWVVRGGVGVALLLTVAVIFALTQPKPDGAQVTRDTTPTLTSYPQKWDSRIAPYAKIAERLRGLDFEHPVKVRFLATGKFEKTVTTDAKKLKKSDRIEIERATALWRAFGLISGDVNLFAAVNDFSGGATLAYYSFDDKTITIRGHLLTPAVRSTLVHELTHALQDQHFNLGDRVKQLRKESDQGPSTTASSVLDAITEGDAERVQTLYRESLTAHQRTALDAAQHRENAKAGKKLTQVPKMIVTLLSSPYTLGQALVQTVAADGGNAAVDDLFRDAPTHESALLDPFLVLAGDTDATEVSVPKVQTDEKTFDSGEFGVMTWYLMLAERLPVADALAAADGWGGDAYVAFERNGTSCARLAYQGRTPRDSTVMFTALQRWVAAVPGSSSSVTRDGKLVQFQSCDPGHAAQAGKDASEDAVALAATRTYLGIGILRSGATGSTARCMAGRLVGAFPVAKLTDPTFFADNPAAQARVQKVMAPCV